MPNPLRFGDNAASPANASSGRVPSSRRGHNRVRASLEAPTSYLNRRQVEARNQFLMMLGDNNNNNANARDNEHQMADQDDAEQDEGGEEATSSVIIAAMPMDDDDDDGTACVSASRVQGMQAAAAAVPIAASATPLSRPAAGREGGDWPPMPSFSSWQPPGGHARVRAGEGSAPVADGHETCLSTPGAEGAEGAHRGRRGGGGGGARRRAGGGRRAASAPARRHRRNTHDEFEDDDGDDTYGDVMRGGVYSIPRCSYYVVPQHLLRVIQAQLDAEAVTEQSPDQTGTNPQRPSPNPTTELPQKSREVQAGDAQPYRPMRVQDDARQPPPQQGRMLEEQRYNLPRCPPYRIPLYDQACMKHIFPNLFDSDFQFMEMFYWIENLVLVIVQIVMVVVNLFFNDRPSYTLPWVFTAGTVIFSVEFGVTMALALFMIITIVHACVTKNVGTKLAQDVAALVTFISTFSVLRAVGLASPSFAMRRIWPRIQNAMNVWDILIAVGLAILWLAACLLAFLALIIKVTQIDFTYSVSITDWTFAQFVQLIGLLMNLARVDDSYYKETSVLLDTVHHHFSTPGDPREAQSMEKPCLLARVMRLLHIPSYMYYEYFDTIFNYHMDWARFEEKEKPSSAGKEKKGKDHGTPQTALNKKKKKKTYNLAYQGDKDAHEACTFDDIPMNMKWRNMFNYISFVFEIDTIQLRRYLQMVQSPLPFYRVGRDAYLMSFADGDPVGMDMAVWRSDPIAPETRTYADSDPSQFNISFVCDDKRDVWDPEYFAKDEKAAIVNADTLVREISRHMSMVNRRTGQRQPQPPRNDLGPRYGARRREGNPDGGEAALVPSHAALKNE